MPGGDRRAVDRRACSRPSSPTGARFAEVEDWSQAERDLAAEAIYRFVFRSIYRLHAFNGDPHPGNYLFRPGGQVTFLDFGLVKRYHAERGALFESLIRTFVVDHDVATFRRLMEDNDVLRRDPTLTDDDVARLLRPLLRVGAARPRSSPLTPEYSSETVRMYFDANGPYAHVARVVEHPARVRDHAAHQPRAHRGARPAPRDRELPPHRRGAVAVRRRSPVDPMGEAEAAWLATK